MMTALTAALVTVLATASGQTDTTLKVRPGARLNVDNFGGLISIQAWGKNTVHIAAAHSQRIKVSVEDQGSDIEIRASSRRGIPGRVDYKIRVPEWMPLALTGVYTDMSVEGAKSEVSAETVKGDVSLLGGEGFIKLSSVQGSVCVGGARGRLELSSVNDGVNVNDVEGELSVDAVNGNVTLEAVRSKMVEAATVNGNVIFVGEIREGGRYRFASHNGDLVIGLPEDASARLSVATFSGEFESAFPVILSQTKRGKRFDFTLGSGSAQIELETFQGTVHLQKAVGLIREMKKQREKEKPCPDQIEEEKK
jgi:DUF4097 and DUF4098 domain-containing protein YvlB